MDDHFNRERRHERRYPATCRLCGVEFRTRYAGRGAFCSTPCKREAKRLRDLLTGADDPLYLSVAHRLGALAVHGSALHRLLSGALERQAEKRAAWEAIPEPKRRELRRAATDRVAAT